MTEAPRDILWRQSSFDAWANAAKPRHFVLLFSVFLLLAAASTFATAVMGPRLVREGCLLWFGTYTEGVIERSTVKRVGAFKGGDPKYELTIDYAFTATNAGAYHGTTLRGDVRSPPAFKPGDPTGIFYEAADPSNSVAEHRLRTDVYALLMFLPFLLVVSVGSAMFLLVRFLRWRSQRGRIPSTAATSSKTYTRAPTVTRRSRR